MLLLSDASTGFVWAGEEFMSEHVSSSSSDTQAFVQTVRFTDCDCDLAKLDLSVEQPGEESDEFWAVFEAWAPQNSASTASAIRSGRSSCARWQATLDLDRASKLQVTKTSSLLKKCGSS